jgi:hypothetical protein
MTVSAIVVAMLSPFASPVGSIQGDRGGKDIAAAAHRLDQLRLLRIDFDPVAQPADVTSMLRSNEVAARPRARSSS